MGMLNKTGNNNIAYSFANMKYSTSSGDIYLEFDINFQTTFQNYLAAANVMLHYNTNVFDISNSPTNWLTRGTFINDATQYPFVGYEILNDEILLSASGLYGDNTTLSNLKQFGNGDLHHLFRIKLKLLPSAPGKMTQLSFSEMEMNLTTPPNFSYISRYATQSAIYTFTTTNTTSTENSIPFDLAIATATDNHRAALPQITALSQNTIVGGNEQTVDIIGRFFGTSGKVELPSADEGDKIKFGDYLTIDNLDIVLWTEKKITVKIPSIVKQLHIQSNTYDYRTMGSGDLHIYNDIVPTQYGIDTKSLEIRYSLSRVLLNNGNLAKVPIATLPGSDAIDISIDVDVFNNTGAMKCIVAAIKQWQCVAGIKFNIKQIGINTNSTTENTISFYTPITGPNLPLDNKIMYTDALPLSCGSGSFRGFDIKINKNMLPYFNYSIGNATTNNVVYFYDAIMHEFGHAIGLAHSVNSSGTWDLMFWTQLNDNLHTRINTISNDDQYGALAIINYGKNISFGSCATNISSPNYAAKNCNNNLNTPAVNIYQIYLSHQCANIISSINPLLKAQISDGINDYNFFWEEMPGNEVVIDNSRSDAPAIKSLKNQPPAQVKYRLTVYDNSDVPSMATKIFSGVLKTGNTFDYAMCDSYEDDLVEPNTHVQWINATNNIWHSQDLWNRINEDGRIEHQNPRFDNSNQNWVYTRIRNIGCNAPISDKYLRLYWTVASTGEKWALDWTKANFNGNPNLPAGNEITDPSSKGILIPVIPPGVEKICSIPWTPPKPTSYGVNSLEACLLARIEETQSYPFQMHTKEFIENNSAIPDGWPSTVPYTNQALKKNIINNNNIVTRNLFVDYVSGVKKRSESHGVLIGKSPTPGDSIGVVIGISPELPTPTQPIDSTYPSNPINPVPEYSQIGDVLIYLPEDLLSEWLANGSQGSGIEYDYSDQSIRVLDNKGVIYLNGLEENRAIL